MICLVGFEPTAAIASNRQQDSKNCTVTGIRKVDSHMECEIFCIATQAMACKYPARLSHFIEIYTILDSIKLLIGNNLT